MAGEKQMAGATEKSKAEHNGDGPTVRPVPFHGMRVMKP